MANFSFRLNGRVVTIDSWDPGQPLLYVLRNSLGLHGPKFGCGLGQCGACTVLMDGKAVRSCMTPIRQAIGRTVTTLEGLGTPEHPDRVQAAFIAEQPDVFLPVAGTWGRNGATHVRLGVASADILAGALRCAWRLRIEKNLNARQGALSAARRRSAATTRNPEVIQMDKRRKAEIRARLTTHEMLESVKRRYGLND